MIFRSGLQSGSHIVKEEYPVPSTTAFGLRYLFLSWFFQTPLILSYGSGILGVLKSGYLRRSAK